MIGITNEMIRKQWYGKEGGTNKEGASESPFTGGR